MKDLLTIGLPSKGRLKESALNFLKKNTINLFKSRRRSELAEALIEFGALICKPKEPKCEECNINKICTYYKSESKIKFSKKIKIYSKSYDIFCYLRKNKKQIGLTKNNNLGF